MAKHQNKSKKSKESSSKGLAIAALLLNFMFFPGIGSLIGGRTREGIWQICLHVGGGIILAMGIVFTVLILTMLIGIPLIVIGAIAMVIGWVWGIVTGIQLIQEAN